MLSINFFNTALFAQSGQKFASNGNILSTGEFFGTTNNFPIIVKVNNVQRGTFTTSGFDIFGNIHSTKNTVVDSILSAWKVMVADALSVGGNLTVGGSATITGNISTTNITASGNTQTVTLQVTGNSQLNDVSASNITAVGNISATNVSSGNISTLTTNVSTLQSSVSNLQSVDSSEQTSINNLQSSVNNQQNEIDTLQLAVGNIKSSQWKNDSINPANIFYSTGNVGIGTTAPAVKLDIYGNERVTGNIFVGGNIVVSNKFSAKTIQVDTIKPTQGAGEIRMAAPVRAQYFSTDTMLVNNRFTALNSIGSDTLIAAKTASINHNLLLGRDSAGISTQSDIASRVDKLMIQSDATKAFHTIINDANAGMVGIGTKFPTEKLTVDGSISVSQNVTAAGNISASGNITANCINTSCLNVTGQTSFDSLQVTGNVHTAGTMFAEAYSSNSPIIFQTPAGKELMRIDDATGNIGIGNNAPGKKLHVTTTHIQGEGLSGSVRIEDILTDNTLPNPGTIATSAWDLEPVLPNGSDPAKFQIGTPGSPLLTLSNEGSGMLGVGIANPKHKLSVSDPTSNFVSVQLTNSATGQAQQDGLCIAMLNSGVLFKNFETDGFSFFDVPGNIQPLTLTANSVEFFNPGFVLGTPPPPKAKIFSDGKAYFSGNVGIGSNNPQATLDVAGDIHTTGVLKSGNSIYIQGLNLPGQPNTIFGSDGVIVFSGGTPGSGINNINIGIGKTPQATLDVNGNGIFSGNVGIGTTVPSEKLEVVGNIRINEHDIFFRSVIPDGNHGLGWYGVDDNNNLDKKFAGVNIDGPVLYGWNGGALAVHQGTTQNIVLRWVADGKVGIGTTDPQAKLHIKDGAITIENDGTTGQWDGWHVAIETDLGYVWRSRYPISDSTYGYSDGGSMIGKYLGFGQTYNGWYWITADAADGTANKKYPMSLTLDKNGLPHLIIENTGWPDYVYEPTHKRMTFAEQEIYYPQNKHLKGLPSAKEIEKSGLDVTGVMNGITQNLEETRLDAIDLHNRLVISEKKNDEQQKQIDELKKEFEQFRKGKK